MDLVAGKKDAKANAEGGKGGKGGKGAANMAKAGGKQKGKAAGLKALEVAQQSTASLGRCVRPWLCFCGVRWGIAHRVDLTALSI